MARPRACGCMQGYGMTEASPGVYMGTHDGTRAHPTSVGVPHFFTDVALLRDDRPEPVGGAAGRAAGPRAARVRRLLEPSGGDRRRPSSTAGGSAPATCSASTTTAGRTSSTGSRTCTSPAARTSTRPRWRPSRCSSTRWPTAPSSGWPTRGGARSAPPTCRCARAPTLTEAELRAHLEANLARYKVPKYLRVRARAAAQRHRQDPPGGAAPPGGATSIRSEQAAASPRPEGAS